MKRYLLALGWWLGAVPMAYAEERCAPVVSLQGEREAVQAVRVLLEGRGIADQPTRGCPVVVARIEAREGGLVLWVQDTYGRTSERPFTAPQTAANLLESWARPELSEPLFQAPWQSRRLEGEASGGMAARRWGQYEDYEEPRVPRELHPERPVYSSQQEDEEEPQAPRELALVERSPRRKLPEMSLWVLSELGGGRDTQGVSFHSGGCVTLGPLCLGGSARVGGALSLDATRPPQQALDLLLRVDAALWKWTVTEERQRDVVSVRVGVAGGVGARRLLKSELILDDGGLVRQGSPWGLRAEMQSALTVPLSRKFLLQVGVTAGLAAAPGEEAFTWDGLYAEGVSWRLALGLRSRRRLPVAPPDPGARPILDQDGVAREVSLPSLD